MFIDEAAAGQEDQNASKQHTDWLKLVVMRVAAAADTLFCWFPFGTTEDSFGGDEDSDCSWEEMLAEQLASGHRVFTIIDHIKDGAVSKSNPKRRGESEYKPDPVSTRDQEGRSSTAEGSSSPHSSAKH